MKNGMPISSGMKRRQFRMIQPTLRTTATPTRHEPSTMNSTTFRLRPLIRIVPEKTPVRRVYRAGVSFALICDFLRPLRPVWDYAYRTAPPSHPKPVRPSSVSKYPDNLGQTHTMPDRAEPKPDAHGGYCASLLRLSARRPTSCCASHLSFQTSARPHVRRGVHQPRRMQLDRHPQKDRHITQVHPPIANRARPTTTMGTQ